MNNQELMDHLVNFATRVFHGTGQVTTMWVLVDAHGGQYVYATPSGSDAQKDATAAVIRAMIQEKHAVRLGFITEAWYARVPPGKSEEEIRHMKPPSIQPDRMCIYISVEDCDGQGFNAMVEIKRGAGGRGELGVPDIRPATGHDRGRFANMFGERTVN